MEIDIQEKNTLCFSVREFIVSRIIDGRLREGDKINEARLCQELGLSRSPVREGIRELIADDILINESFKGTRVGAFNDKELSDLNSLRIMLEQMAVDYSVPRMTDATRKGFSEIVEKMKEAENANDTQKLTELDMEFHYYLISQSCSNVIISTWKRIFTKLSILMAMRLKFRAPKKQYQNHLELVRYYSVENIHLFKEMLVNHEHMGYFSVEASEKT